MNFFFFWEEIFDLSFLGEEILDLIPIFDMNEVEVDRRKILQNGWCGIINSLAQNSLRLWGLHKHDNETFCLFSVQKRSLQNF